MYYQLLESKMHFMITTDIMFVARKLNCYVQMPNQSKPNQSNLEAVRKIITYVDGTLDFDLYVRKVPQMRLLDIAMLTIRS